MAHLCLYISWIDHTNICNDFVMIDVSALDYTVKPVWNGHPRCQEKLVFPDRWSFQTCSLCIEFNGRQEFLEIGKRSFQTGWSFQRGRSRQASLYSQTCLQWLPLVETKGGRYRQVATLHRSYDLAEKNIVAENVKITFNSFKKPKNTYNQLFISLLRLKLINLSQLVTGNFGKMVYFLIVKVYSGRSEEVATHAGLTVYVTVCTFMHDLMLH